MLQKTLELTFTMRRLFGFKGNLPQALRRSLIIAYSNSLIEIPINRLCYKPLYFSQLEK